MGELLTVDEVAAVLRMHRDTVVRLITSGSLPAYRVGQRRWRIERDALAKYLESVAVARPEA